MNFSELVLLRCFSCCYRQILREQKKSERAPIMMIRRGLMTTLLLSFPKHSFFPPLARRCCLAAPTLLSPILMSTWHDPATSPGRKLLSASHLDIVKICHKIGPILKTDKRSCKHAHFYLLTHIPMCLLSTFCKKEKKMRA